MLHGPNSQFADMVAETAGRCRRRAINTLYGPTNESTKKDCAVDLTAAQVGLYDVEAALH